MRNPFATLLYQMRCGIITSLEVIDDNLGIVALFKNCLLYTSDAADE